jgi:hypothetical protein
MLKFRAIAIIPAVIATLILTGCGLSSKEALVSVTVSPSAASATHSSATDTITFKATGNYAAYDVGYYGPNATAVCDIKISDMSQTLTQVTWSTSDPINTSIDAHGVATCLGATTSPATITALASGICGGEKAKATLTCN